MEAYKLIKTDMQGFLIQERYFRDPEKAKKEFDIEIENYRANEKLASDIDAAENNINNEAISISENENDQTVKSALICLWYRCSYEENEWDITAEHLELIKIEIEE